jgi:predicted translin family RNA/ssDNA-binding protein
MSEKEVLLKIKREFLEAEAVQILLKKISELEYEIGVLKSERDEALEIGTKIQIGEAQTKKAWLKEELIARMDEEIKENQKNNTEMRRQLEEWKEKYFSLMHDTHNDEKQ